jgi:hypothetical protein
MHLIIGAFVVLLVVMFFVAYAITMAFDEKELPKIVGAAFASFSAAVAILLFYLSRARDEERSQCYGTTLGCYACRRSNCLS